jgi:hypothetical protein
MRAVELGQRSSIVLAELGQHLAAAGQADAVASSDCSIASKSSTSVCASWQAIDHDTLPPP